MWNVSGLEAAYRDYRSQGVRFFFIYKSLAHPELTGNYVQPFTLPERLAHAKQAEKQLGATIPWLVDDIDNPLKHALGNRPNSEFIIDPNGIIVRKRAWSHPAQVRKDLEELVGPVGHVTREEDIHLRLELPVKSAAPRGFVTLIDRSRMQVIEIEPRIDPQGLPFFAKLRAEADEDLITSGAGQLYLGFHLDPFHDAHWNNLTKPLSFALELPEGVTVDKATGESPPVQAVSDTDPREFLLKVNGWPTDKPIQLTVKYFACVGEQACHALKQEYVLHLRRDRDAGRARGEGAGYWDSEFIQQMLARDKDRDGQLNHKEVQGLVLPHFEQFDTNKDGLLNRHELLSVADWLNHHHQPGSPPPGWNSVREQQPAANK